MSRGTLSDRKKDSCQNSSLTMVYGTIPSAFAEMSTSSESFRTRKFRPTQNIRIKVNIQ